jgi:hypothetical protein
VDLTRLLRRIEEGHVSNVRFRDLTALVLALGFELRRTSGSHHIFAHPSVDELINLQEVAACAKPYQVRHVAHLVRKYDLRLRGEK